DAVFGDSSIDAERWTASEDFSEIPRHFDVPYLFWTAGITPDEQWEKRDETPVPANHMATFLPDLSTISSTTKAAAAAPLSFLFKE
ncbi:MAG: amidohydrolase, partial [Corynebacterium kroppenstedtii]|nr:amidohydrolase [Corynebacterium kroppenstedtii]